uniref:RRM domain-containing protein n=1 Tax=Ditylenchus dipsaci TaxID=166011 RepID=A0A915DGX8_9BILA
MILTRMLASCSGSALLLQPLVNPLAENSTEDSIKQFYSQFGNIKAFKSVHEADLRHSLKHVFVSYSSKDELDTAMSQLPHVIDGSNVWVFPMPEALPRQQKSFKPQIIEERQEQELQNKPCFELLIGKLSPASTFQSILDFYTKFDPDIKVSLRMNEDGHTICTALIMFSSVEGLIKSVNQPAHKINGKRVEVYTSKKTERHQVHVSNLSAHHSQISLRRHFSQFGRLLECTWNPRERNPITMNTYAFVGYETKEEADRALAHTCHEIEGFAVEVGRAIPSGRKKEAITTELEDIADKSDETKPENSDDIKPE